MKLAIRYRAEVVSRSSGTRFVLWRRVGGGPERGVGGMKGDGIHHTREQVAASLENQKRADRAACSRLEIEANISIV